MEPMPRWSRNGICRQPARLSDSRSDAMSLFQPHLLVQYLVSADFFHGAEVTLSLSIASLATGMVVGLLLAVGQEVPLRAVRAFVVFYLWLFRGTPVLLQLV